MSALPCWADQAARSYATQDDAEQVWLGERARALHRDYLQDLSYIHDALGDLSCRPLGKMVDLLVLVRDGADNAELGRLIRQAVDEEVYEAAQRAAEKELDQLHTAKDEL